MNDKNVGQMSTWEKAVLWLKAQPDQKELIEACFYDDPLQEAADRYHQSTEWSSIKTYLPKAGNVLDIGAGRGISSYAFAKEGWKVKALEPDSSDIVGAGAIEYLSRHCELDIEVEQTWGEELPFDDNSFDVVHGRQVLHHARNLPQFCKEASRVLKPNGTFIFTREHVISKSEDLDVFLEAHPLHKLYGGENAYRLKEYKSALQNNGLLVKKMLNPLESNINLYPDTIVGFKKKLAKKFMIPDFLITNLILKIYGDRLNSPGRLYSFIGNKNV